MNVMRFLAGLGFGAAAGFAIAAIGLGSGWAIAPAIICLIGAILITALHRFTHGQHTSTPLSEAQLDFLLSRGPAGTAEVLEIERTNGLIGDIPVYQQVLLVEPGDRAAYRTIAREAIDPVMGPRTVGTRIPIVRPVPDRPRVAFNQRGSVEDSRAGSDGQRYGAASAPFWTEGYDDERLNRATGRILPKLKDFRLRTRRSPVVPVIAFLLGLVLALAPSAGKVAEVAEDALTGRLFGTDLRTDPEAAEAALSRFSEKTGTTHVCTLLIVAGHMSLEAPKAGGGPGLDDWSVRLRDHSIWSESDACDRELVAISDIDTAALSQAYERAITESGFTADELVADRCNVGLMRDPLNAGKVRVRAYVAAAGERSFSRSETLAGEHLYSILPGGEVVHGPAYEEPDLENLDLGDLNLGDLELGVPGIGDEHLPG